MSENRADKAYVKVAQLLATSDLQSTLSEKYAKEIFHKEGNINFQISADTVLGSTKPELLGCTVLYLAYERCKVDLFNLLLNHGANPNIKNARGCTILHQIIEDIYQKDTGLSLLEKISDNPFVTSVLDALVRTGNSSNSCNEKLITHLHIACMANHKAAVELFLRRKKLINQSVAKDSSLFPGYTAVHFAARFASSEVVKLLLENSASEDIKDAKGMTPLHILLHQNIEIVDLLNKDEVVNAEQLISRRKSTEDKIHLLLSEQIGQTKVIDDTNLTRLHIACIMESLQITDDLLCRITYIDQAVNEKLSVFSGNTALHFAALCNVEKVKLLLEKGANIHMLNAKNETPFGLCIDRYDLKDIQDIIASQSNWRDVEISTPGRTLLNLVSCLQPLNLTPFLTKSGYINAFINKKSSLWPTYHLLHVAVLFSERGCKNDSMIIGKIMQASGTSINQLARFGISPLNLAFRLKRAKIVNFLLMYHFNATNLVDADQLSHLHIACAAGATIAVEKLLKTKSNTYTKVKTSFEWYRYYQFVRNDVTVSRDIYIPKGSTPLHVAVIVGHCESIRMLLENEASIYDQDEYGMTPIHWLIVSENPVSPAADILLPMNKPISSISSVNNNKGIVTNAVFRECIAKNGLSHLHVACFANKVTAVEQLLEAGCSKVNGTLLCTADAETKKIPGILRYAGYTPLHFALEKKNKKIISLLIQHGAEIVMESPIKKSIPLFEAFNDKKSPCSDILISFFKNNKALQKQLEENYGFTMLHFYCCILDDKAAEDFLKHRAVDVNKNIIEISPIWPGFTPMHILMKFHKNSDRAADTMLNLLLYYGADVTALNAEQNTPLHLAYLLNSETSVKTMLLKTLLRSDQKNFDNNSRNREGISHFHIACALVDIVAMKKFLKSELCVNQPVDYFYKNKKLSGCTPLHLVLRHPLNKQVDVANKIKAVDLLIQHGANVNAENIQGYTPLHIAVKYHTKCIELLKKIIDNEGDIYAKNVLAQTPLELLLNSKVVTVAGIEFFLDRGYPVNEFNYVTDKGFIAMSFPTNFYSESQSLVFELMIKACGNSLDNRGMTVIHNVVSSSAQVTTNSFYIKLIESLAKTVDIDHQDNLGRTALHVATQFKNHRAVFALLQVGADINVIDSNDKTAFAYAFEYSLGCEDSKSDAEKIVKIFLQYVQKLNVCQIYVHEKNHNALIEAFKSCNDDISVSERFYDELERMRKVKIDSSSITLLNIISGINGQSVSSCISKLKRDVIDNLYTKIDNERFWEALGIIRLQCRKLSKNIEAC